LALGNATTSVEITEHIFAQFEVEAEILHLNINMPIDIMRWHIICLLPDHLIIIIKAGLAISS